MKPSLNFLSASKLAEMIRAGEITTRQTVEAYLAQIEKQNPTYNAIVTLNEGQALAQAIYRWPSGAGCATCDDSLRYRRKNLPPGQVCTGIMWVASSGGSWKSVSRPSANLLEH